jgi:hydrogenase maturation protease
MATEEQIRESLEQVLIPGAMRSLDKLNMIREVAISDEKVNVNLASTGLNQEVQEWLKAKVRDTVKVVPGVNEVETEFIEARATELNQVSNIIAVMSGKGGVGKSLVTSLTAVSLAREGYDVGVLDADITGPSIPKLFGLSARPVGTETGILPVLSRTGVAVISLNLLLPHEDDAVIWRGPLIDSTIKQFWEEVLWGRLDYLVIDLPPGTADASLPVMQAIPLSGIVIVFSPQELAAMVVRKAVQMTKRMNIPIIGLVENMSYLVMPGTGQKLEIFGTSKVDEMIEVTGAPLLAQMPIDPELARLCDEGNIERYDSKMMKTFAESLLKAVPAKSS